ncbi:MAG: hypothetical protein KAI72_04395, partial [Candidatus Pacebacteria bacterium]|nr:hypothetical protein [Candidatus Paceibacterota bacterium]
PRNIVNNDNQIYFVDDSSRLGRARVNVVSMQGDLALIEKSLSDSIKIITSILQKPLLGMPIEDMSNAIVENDTTIVN